MQDGPRIQTKAKHWAKFVGNILYAIQEHLGQSIIKMVELFKLAPI